MTMWLPIHHAHFSTRNASPQTTYEQCFIWWPPPLEKKSFHALAPNRNKLKVLLQSLGRLMVVDFKAFVLRISPHSTASPVGKPWNVYCWVEVIVPELLTLLASCNMAKEEAGSGKGFAMGSWDSPLQMMYFFSGRLAGRFPNLFVHHFLLPNSSTSHSALLCEKTCTSLHSSPMVASLVFLACWAKTVLYTWRYFDYIHYLLHSYGQAKPLSDSYTKEPCHMKDKTTNRNEPTCDWCINPLGKKSTTSTLGPSRTKGQRQFATSQHQQRRPEPLLPW